jgi:tRNA A37 N6-isopentenylltransferase MiaA
MSSIYKYRRITTEGPNGTTLYFKNADEGDRALELAEVAGWHYVSVPETAQLPAQPTEIEWQAVTLDAENKASIMASSRAVQLINQGVVDQIRALYSVDDELKLLRTAPSAEFEAYNAHAEDCRAWGRAEKAKLGL